MHTNCKIICEQKCKNNWKRVCKTNLQENLQNTVAKNRLKEAYMRDIVGEERKRKEDTFYKHKLLRKKKSRNK